MVETSRKWAYYNENDPFTAAWLRELIEADLIADGEVDERSIEAVSPNDVRGFRQCHFFAGIGGWSYALRLAGWADDRAVWTGSCPCQPFSAAGKGDGAADSRHLWPTWFRLISESSPHVVFGEQVASADGLGWFDRVSTDLEGAGYAVGALDLCAASVGAFHIRQRLWFVADANDQQKQSRDIGSGGEGMATERKGSNEPRRVSPTRSVADTTSDRRTARAALVRRQARRDDERSTSRLGDASQPGLEGHGRLRNITIPTGRKGAERHDPETSRVGTVGYSDCTREAATGGLPRGPEPERGRSFWAEAEWLACRDGKARPVEPGTFPLADGLPARVGRLRGYGNAIVPPLAAEFIKAYREVIGEDLHGL